MKLRCSHLSIFRYPCFTVMHIFVHHRDVVCFHIMFLILIRNNFVLLLDTIVMISSIFVDTFYYHIISPMYVVMHMNAL